MQAKLLFLGTGSSAGVPMVGCHCAVCQSKNPKNKRLRPSVLLEMLGKRILIDVGPDFREQALRYHIDDLDGVILTHTHFDHIAGIDELRSYYLLHEKRFPVLVSHSTLDELKRRFSYLFAEKVGGKTLSAQLDFHLMKRASGSMRFLGIPLFYTTYTQGGMDVSGLRFGKLAYLTDISHYQESIFKEMAGVEILIVSALRKKSSPVHFNLSEAIEFAKKIGAKKTYFTHLSHELEYRAISKELPLSYHLAYDGIKIEFNL